MTNEETSLICFRSTVMWWTDGVFYLALVSATLRRRGSFRKPMPWCSLARTHDRMMKSFSLPWKASTLAISTCWNKTGGGLDCSSCRTECFLLMDPGGNEVRVIQSRSLPDTVWCAENRWIACTAPGRSADPHKGWWCQSGRVWLQLSAAGWWSSRRWQPQSLKK